MKTIRILIIVTPWFVLSCGRSFLDVKPDVRLNVPTEISDFDRLLANSLLYGRSAIELGIIGGDEFVVSDAGLLTVTNVYERNAYKWQNDVFEGKESNDWNYAYQRILYANMALEVEKIQPAEEELDLWNQVRARAYFFRALNYYHLAQLFCKQYSPAIAQSAMGLPMRLTPDINTKVSRGTLYDTYRQILDDAKKSYELLPRTVADKFRPGKAAACVLLSRIYLHMEEYGEAEKYADLGLEIQADLIDFNTLDANKDYPFPDRADENIEVIINLFGPVPSIVGLTRFQADENLLRSYGAGDLRRSLYFFNRNGLEIFGGTYQQNSTRTWGGFATDELWLISAECKARRDDITESLLALNHLLQHRYELGLFVPLVAADKIETLALIYRERRKEMVLRGVRWEDLRRFNKEPEFATTLTRSVNGELIQLAPDDPRWVWPIPDNEVTLNNIPQNQR